MKVAMKTLVVSITIFVLLLGALYFYLGGGEKAATKITTFEECAEAGNSVMESYPRQCRDKEGNNFVEDIGNELEKKDLILLNSPRPNEVIESPLTIRGEARGTWFFEGDFPVVLTDWDGRIIAEHYLTAQGEWMTEDFVPFEGTITFETPSLYDRGSLILQKDNASGLPEHNDALEIPIRFNLPDANSYMDSGIEGTVMIGPTCPVMREGMEEECADKPYATEIIIKSADGSREIARVNSDDSGHFKYIIQPGTYLLDPQTPEGKPLPRARMETVTVKDGEFAKIQINFDSGIR